MHINNFFQSAYYYILYIILIFKIFINRVITWFDVSVRNLLITQNNSIYIFVHFSKKSLTEYTIYTLIIHFNFVIDFGLSSFEYRVERKLSSLINTLSFSIFGINKYTHSSMGNKSNEYNTHHVVKFDHLK